jgi:hypothetical protein
MLDAARLQPQRTVVQEGYRLRAAVDKIRSMKGFATVPIVFIPEDGPPGAGERLFAYIAAMGPIMAMCEAGSTRDQQLHRYGVPKSPDDTLKMKDMMVEAIDQQHPRVRLSAKLFSLPHEAQGLDTESTLKKLKEQMANYRVLVKKVYGQYWNDDILVTAMMLYMWSDTFLKRCRGDNPTYTKFAKEWIHKIT